MLDTAVIDAPAPAVAAKPSLENLKERLAKAKIRSNSKRIEEVKDEIADLDAQTTLVRQKESSVAIQLKALNNEQQDNIRTIEDIRANAEVLKIAGEDPLAMERDAVALLNDVKARIERSANDTRMLEKERGDIVQKLSSLRSEMLRLEGKAPVPQQRTTYEEVYMHQDKLLKCRKDIQTLWFETGTLPGKLAGFPNDITARTYFIQDIAGDLRAMQQEMKSSLTETEWGVMKQIAYALSGIGKKFGVNYIEALDLRNSTPRDYPCWRQYCDNTKKCRSLYFNPSPIPMPIPAEIEQKYGIVRPAAPAPQQPAPKAPEPEKPLAEVVKEVAKAISKPLVPPAPRKKRENTNDKVLMRMIHDTNVAEKTTGMRAAIIANAKAMNEQMRAFIEEAFGFKRVLWTDGNDDKVSASMKSGGVDIVFSNKEYKRLINIAKKQKIKTVLLDGHSKALVCKKICEFFGKTLNTELVA